MHSSSESNSHLQAFTPNFTYAFLPNKCQIPFPSHPSSFQRTNNMWQEATYRVFQKESAILWKTIVCVILSKKVNMNMGPILNVYRDMVKRRYGPFCEHEQQYVINNITPNITCIVKRRVNHHVLLTICNGQNPGSSTCGTSHNKFSKMLSTTSMHDGGPLHGHRHC
jgi:hypothetical protein